MVSTYIHDIGYYFLRNPDPLFHKAVETFCLAFHNPNHTVVSVPSVTGGKYDMLPVLSAGMVGGCIAGGHVHIAVEDHKDDSQDVLGVICWVGPGQEAK